jgi:hypothetical protein
MQVLWYHWNWIELAPINGGLVSKELIEICIYARPRGVSPIGETSRSGFKCSKKNCNILTYVIDYAVVLPSSDIKSNN